MTATDSLSRASVRAITPTRRGPVYCVWELTLACDLACRHCGSRAGNARAGELTTPECLDVVRQLAEAGVRDVALIGGEAYLRPDWPEIAEAVVAAGMTCRMVTGARGLDDERLAKAAEAGLANISVSLDGLERAHDRQRGRGSFAAATDAMRRIRRSAIKLACNTQLNRLSVPDIEPLARLLVELGVRAWQVQLTVPMGRAADRVTELVLQPYELLDLYPRLAAIQTDILRPARIQLAPANNIGYFGPFESVLRLGGDQGVHWEGCPAGQWALGIEADGSLKGCPSLPSASYIAGNLRTTRLASLLRSEPLRRLADRDAAALWGFCRSCYYAEVCKGGCSWTAHATLGRPGNNPFCHHRALELRARGRRERLVPAEPAPGLPFDHGRLELVEEAWPDPPASRGACFGDLTPAEPPPSDTVDRS